MTAKLTSARRHAIRLLAVLFIFSAALFPQGGLRTAEAQLIGVEFIFDVVPDPPVLNELPETGTTFYLEGKVYPFRSVDQAECDFNVAEPRQVGVWRAWGTVSTNGRAVVNQSLQIHSPAGTIEIQGVSGILTPGGNVGPARPGDINGPTAGPSETLAVTGGTGVYRAVNGEAHIRPYCSDPSAPFRYDRPFCIGIIEGKRK